jgi:RNA polymerase sigma factor (TIGR02999 family)
MRLNVSETGSDAVMSAAQPDDEVARDRLFAMLYQKLRSMAQREVRRSAAVTLSPTTLLHETFLNVSQRESVAFTDPRQFISYAARAMRGLMIDYFRSRNAQKRGGVAKIMSLPTDLAHAPDDDNQPIDAEKLRDALQSLGQISPRLAESVDLKFFCGLTFSEIAQLQGVSERTIQRNWQKARLLLNCILSSSDGDERQTAS